MILCDEANKSYKLQIKQMNKKYLMYNETFPIIGS